LDRKTKKRFEAAMLTQLGAKREKGPRISAPIGLGGLCYAPFLFVSCDPHIERLIVLQIICALCWYPGLCSASKLRLQINFLSFFLFLSFYLLPVGMAKKQGERDARALQEAIAAGMVKQKGMGKKKRAAKAAGLDRGLMEDKGAFRGGVLHVREQQQGGGSKRGPSSAKRKK
jgi:hypothetical protein